jgi:hypothetical protein
MFDDPYFDPVPTNNKSPITNNQKKGFEDVGTDQ